MMIEVPCGEITVRAIVVIGIAPSSGPDRIWRAVSSKICHIVVLRREYHCYAVEKEEYGKERKEISCNCFLRMILLAVWDSCNLPKENIFYDHPEKGRDKSKNCIGYRYEWSRCHSSTAAPDLSKQHPSLLLVWYWMQGQLCTREQC